MRGVVTETVNSLVKGIIIEDDLNQRLDGTVATRCSSRDRYTLRLWHAGDDNVNVISL